MVTINQAEKIRGLADAYVTAKNTDELNGNNYASRKAIRRLLRHIDRLIVANQCKHKPLRRPLETSLLS